MELFNKAIVGNVTNRCTRFNIKCPNCRIHVVTLHALARDAKSTMGACLSIQLLTGCSTTHHEPRSDATCEKDNCFLHYSMMRLAMHAV